MVVSNRSSTQPSQAAATRERPMSAAFDAVVIGGGPAGSAIARLLALWGHSVVVLTTAADAARGAAESLPPSTRKLLATIGVLESVDCAGFYRTTGNTVWWGMREGHVEQFDASGEAFGYQVYRPELDRILLAGAADGATTKVRRGPTLHGTYRAEIGKTRQLSALMAGATLGRVWACDASLYSSHAYAGPRFLLVGDAASSIDPLSSFGVKKALASAWVGAVAVHTCLTHPDRQAVALDFSSNRDQQIYAPSLRRSCAYAREAYERHPHPFWAERAGTTVPPANGEIDEGTLFRAPDVQAAFRRLKESPAIELSLSGGIGVRQCALIHDREIVIDEAISLPEAPDGVRFIAGVDLLKLGEMACRHRQVPDLFEAYCRAYGAVPLPSLLGSLSVLLARGVLEAR